MKARIKYPVIVLCLLLVGYTQVFAHIYGPINVVIGEEVHHSCEISVAPIANSSSVDSIFIEEEEEENKERRVSSLDLFAIVSTYIPGDFVHRVADKSVFSTNSLYFSYFRSRHLVLCTYRI